MAILWEHLNSIGPTQQILSAFATKRSQYCLRKQSSGSASTNANTIDSCWCCVAQLHTLICAWCLYIEWPQDKLLVEYMAARTQNQQTDVHKPEGEAMHMAPCLF